MELTGRYVLADGFRFMRWLDLGGHEKAMKRTAKNLDRVVQRWLDEHKARRDLAREEATGVKGEQDFMDVLLSILEDNPEIRSYDSDTINKKLLACKPSRTPAMILAGTDTITITMTWTLSLLLNHMEALKNVQQELDTQIGRDRLYLAGPLSVLHEAIEDCNISGYFVPKGTQIMLNLYKIHCDTSVWPDLFEFQPERFLTAHKDVNMPGDKAVDMEEAIGLTNIKATPLEVLVTSRVPEHVMKRRRLQEGGGGHGRLASSLLIAYGS
ncbi:cytochrome P450 82A1-like [Punica granatum]|uniref:Cytochrome P450 82A1-like n=1 Tax=Punica granatum TaxID=22663 RepID=A0A6P8D1A9_PUNGR|nr:cytochrome P450 82A1-like [Punica granatum]